MKNLIKCLGKIPVSNYFLSQIFKQTEFKEEIKKDFPENFGLDFWLPFFETSNSRGNLLYCKNLDWHIDLKMKNRKDYPFTILWVLKTRNSTLKVKTSNNKIESLDLKKGMLVTFPNYREHTLFTKENNISCFLVIDFITKNLKYTSTSTIFKIENFVDYISSGNSLR